ncbi:hypothetical protein B0H10DRAFT_1796307 [Mycena sp. CBHHK59/15]|nr:hypothetical protein B0H10DRAFT_1796307 [Mycena sp. CBHHK59/15]
MFPPRDVTTDVGNGNTTSLFTLIPVAFDIALPWWTQVPGTAIDIIISALAVGSWSDGGSAKPVTKLKIAMAYGSSALLFVQSVSGLANILQNAHSLEYLQRLGASSYAALFANAMKLWDRALLADRKLLTAGWINILLSLAIFVTLSLPVVGSAPQFTAFSPYCTWVLDDGTGHDYRAIIGGGGSNAICYGWNWNVDLSPTQLDPPVNDLNRTEVRCAAAGDLNLGWVGGRNGFKPMQSWSEVEVLSWGFSAGVLALLVGSAWMQII